MDDESILNYFNEILQTDPSSSAAIAALKTLMEFMERDSSETLLGLRENLLKAIEVLTTADSSVTTVSSGCELFLRFITLTAKLDHADFSECKKVLSERGRLFLKKVTTSRDKIAKLGNPFILDNCTVLTHSCSRVVYQTLVEAFEAKKRFHVYVTESCPNRNGLQMCEWLKDKGIPYTLILDAAIGYIMEKIDLVLVGAEGIVESGGIINKIGTYPLAICARKMNKPFYVLAESIKFVRLYPLNQKDIPDQFKYNPQTVKNKDLSKEHPLVDFTPPSYITLLFTDLGILTPSAVSDELIKLYQ
ncbi:translation initiation factor eIF2B subunit alpha [Centruroides vittatus]|uniref:translation initiation factor eIF2B subunit alpha n=1 Tax=Centruroides vittatus TaxID=120091 RepID=UPI00350EEA38